MRKKLLKAWNTALIELRLLEPRIDALGQAWFKDIMDKFPVGWFKPVRSPARFWFIERLGTLLGDFIDLVTGYLSVVPGLIIQAIVLDTLTISPKLRQRVMPLDQVALFPVKIIVEQGFREIVQGGYPAELRVADAGQRLEKLFKIAQTGSLATLKKFLFGSVWGRIVKLAFLIVQWGTVLAYLALLLQYLKKLEDSEQWGTLFSAALYDKNPRKKQRVLIRRRMGGVAP